MFHFGIYAWVCKDFLLTEKTTCKDYLQVKVKMQILQSYLGKRLSAIMRMDWDPETVLKEVR